MAERGAAVIQAVDDSGRVGSRRPAFQTAEAVFPYTVVARVEARRAETRDRVAATAPLQQNRHCPTWGNAMPGCFPRVHVLVAAPGFGPAGLNPGN